MIDIERTNDKKVYPFEEEFDERIPQFENFVSPDKETEDIGAQDNKKKKKTLRKVGT